MKNILIGLILGTFSIAGAHAGQIALKSGEVLDSKTIKLPETFTIVLTDGTEQTVKTKDVQSIQLQKNPSIKNLIQQNEDPIDPQSLQSALDEFRTLSPFETPKQTFLTWKKYAEDGSIDGMTQCYASYRQDQVKKNLKKIKKKARKEMQHTMQVVDFIAADPIYQGKQAFLEVTWSKGLHSESQVLKFILEKDQWKIIE